MANRKVIFDIEANDKSGKGIKSSENSLSKLNKSLVSMTGIGITAAGAIAGIAAASKKAVAAASDLEETTSKTTVVFGKATASVLEFGKTSATSLGMSENAALAAAATYGNLFRAMGMAEDKSAEMSISLVKLAADLASFNNLDPSEVFEKLRAGLTGEGMPLKSLGINLNETTLKIKAMELGLFDGKGALDASSKASAAYALMVEQTSLAQGDFERTSEGLANQQRILKASMEDLAATMGNKLKPVFIWFTGYLAKTADYIDILFNSTETFLNIQERWANQMSGDSRNYDEYLRKILENADAMGLLHYSVDTYLRAIENGKNLPEELADKIGLLSEREYALLKYTQDLDPSIEGVKIQMGHLRTETELLDESSTGLASTLGKTTDYFGKLTQQMLFNKAAAGLDAQQAMLLAQGMGLVDQGTLSAINAISAMNEKFKDTGDIQGYINEVSALNDLLNGLHDIEISVQVSTILAGMDDVIGVGGSTGSGGGGSGTQTASGTQIGGTAPAGWSQIGTVSYTDLTPVYGPGNAAGGSGIVPPGFNHENYMLPLSSGEKYSVTPSSRVGASERGGEGGGGNTYIFNANGITNPDEFIRWAGQKVKQQGGLPQ